MKTELERDLAEPALAKVLAAAPHGPDRVKRALVGFLAEPLKDDVNA